MQLSAPSKTFLIGEYLAVRGGPSIVLNTFPRFELEVHPADSLVLKGIPTASPAARFIDAQNTESQGNIKFSFEFRDPHLGKGGFGASSAQFALCYRFFYPNCSAQELLQEYRTFAASGRGVLPSGADVMAQSFGCGLSLVEGHAVSQLDWPFADFGLLLVRTGKKVATHEHLAQLKIGDVSGWSEGVSKCWQSLRMRNEQQFVECVHDYRLKLESRGWIAETTREILEQISNWPGVLAAKGCGALGADVVMIVAETEKLDSISRQVRTIGLETVAASGELCTGWETH